MAGFVQATHVELYMCFKETITNTIFIDITDVQFIVIALHKDVYKNSFINKWLCMFPRLMSKLYTNI